MTDARKLLEAKVTTADDLLQEEEMSAEKELLPCPFCGGEKVSVQAVPNTGGNVQYIWCHACRSHGGWADKGLGKSPQEEWNRRAAPQEAGRNAVIGFALAMHVFQSDLYRQLDDVEAAELHELIHQGQRALASSPASQEAKEAK